MDLRLNLRTICRPFNDDVREIRRTKRCRCDDIASRDILFVSAVESLKGSIERFVDPTINLFVVVYYAGGKAC